MGGLGDVVSNLLGRQAEGTDLGGQGAAGGGNSVKRKMKSCSLWSLYNLPGSSDLSSNSPKVDVGDGGGVKLGSHLECCTGNVVGAEQEIKYSCSGNMLIAAQEIQWSCTGNIPSAAQEICLVLHRKYNRAAQEMYSSAAQDRDIY